jgi:pimeloyl-ACP methyl ester carboxylesterase
MKNIERDHVKIAYKDAGEGDTTLLFVHGSFIDMNYWSAQKEYFKQYYRIITIDLPGHGKSGKGRTTWSIQEFGDDVCTVINELNLKNVILIGHSMGGDVILEAAVKCPDAVIGFVGVDNFKNAATALSAEIQMQADQIMAMLKSDFANTSESFARQALLSSTTNQAIIDRVVSDYRVMDKNIGIDIISSAFSYYQQERILMKQMKLKMYLINVDNTVTNEELLKKYAACGYDLLSINGTCHFPMIENTVEFNRILQDIIVKIKAHRKKQALNNKSDAMQF